MSGVKICTSVGRSKEYTIPILKKVLPLLSENPEKDCIIAWDGVPVDEEVPGAHLEINSTDKSARINRIAYMRAMSRNLALEDKKWTHLYWHDCDMVPENGIIDRFKEHDTEIITGAYSVRYVMDPVVLPMLDVGGTNFSQVVNVADTSIITSDEEYITVDAFGQGCMLIKREVVEKTPYRAPSYYAKNAIGEDYQWCLDAKANCNALTIVSVHENPWHCDQEGANKLNVGELERAAVYKGSSTLVTNAFGIWQKYIPQYHHSESVLALLSEAYDFNVGKMARVSVNRESLQQLLATL